MPSSPESDDSRPLDPVFVNARREAIWILGLYVACLIWSVGWSAALGYAPPSDEVTTVLGMPLWVFVAVALPWLAADVFTVWFCFFYMVDDDLGEDTSL